MKKISGLKEYNFPENFRRDPVILGMAKLKGFYRKDTPYNRLFALLFIRSGDVKVQFKENLCKNFKNKALAYLKKVLNSEIIDMDEKDAIGSLILSELVEGGVV